MNTVYNGSLRKIRSSAGVTIVELLIACLISATVAAASFQFYSSMHGAAMAQDTISELQHQGRNTLRDMRKTVRMAGFDLDSHIPYLISGDTLAIYFSMTQPVDTVLYYLDEFSSSDYLKVLHRPTGRKLYRLYKKTNSEQAGLYADFVNEFTVVQMNSTTLIMSITVMAERADDRYTENNGYRTYSQGERVSLRNVS